MDTAEIIKKIRKIEITTKSLVNELFSGEYHSVFKGQGLEFSEVREYQPGDSFKQIDWNVSARMGQPYIKKFEETRELNVIFLVDCSASTVFGTRSYLKSEYITEVAGVLSFSAISNNDKVGLLMFTDEIEKYNSPRKGKKTALRILRDILYHEPQHKGTDIKKAVEYVYRLAKKKSVIFLISDFFGDNFDQSLRLLAKKHDVIAILVRDQLEFSLPGAGLIDFEDPETGQILSVNTMSKKLRNSYQKATENDYRNLINRFKKMKIDLIALKTNEPYTKNLMSFFEQRIRKRNR